MRRGGHPCLIDARGSPVPREAGKLSTLRERDLRSVFAIFWQRVLVQGIATPTRLPPPPLPTLLTKFPLFSSLPFEHRNDEALRI